LSCLSTGAGGSSRLGDCGRGGTLSSGSICICQTHRQSKHQHKVVAINAGALELGAAAGWGTEALQARTPLAASAYTKHAQAASTSTVDLHSWESSALVHLLALHCARSSSTCVGHKHQLTLKIGTLNQAVAVRSVACCASPPAAAVHPLQSHALLLPHTPAAADQTPPGCGSVTQKQQQVQQR
jgi:hypothetical protein